MKKIDTTLRQQMEEIFLVDEDTDRLPNDKVLDSLLSLFEKTVTEAIGEDEPEHYAGTFFHPLPGINFPNIERNRLRSEQRTTLKKLIGGGK